MRLSQMILNSMGWVEIRLDQIRSGVRRERDIVIPASMSMMIAIMIDLNIVIINIRGRGGRILSSFQVSSSRWRQHSQAPTETYLVTYLVTQRDLSSHLSSHPKRPV